MNFISIKNKKIHTYDYPEDCFVQKATKCRGKRADIAVFVDAAEPRAGEAGRKRVAPSSP